MPSGALRDSRLLSVNTQLIIAYVLVHCGVSWVEARVEGKDADVLQVVLDEGIPEVASLDVGASLLQQGTLLFEGPFEFGKGLVPITVHNR